MFGMSEVIPGLLEITVSLEDIQKLYTVQNRES
jgi:hypothetical protein